MSRIYDIHESCLLPMTYLRNKSFLIFSCSSFQFVRHVSGSLSFLAMSRSCASFFSLSRFNRTRSSSAARKKKNQNRELLNAKRDPLYQAFKYLCTYLLCGIPAVFCARSMASNVLIFSSYASCSSGSSRWKSHGDSCCFLGTTSLALLVVIKN